MDLVSDHDGVLFDDEALTEPVHAAHPQPGEECIDLVSAGDRGELAAVSAEYARDHLQLAYASTVHGVQGETAEASLVGPEADAAGLNVDLTSGRAHNAAIVIAHTDAEARERLSDSMQRGTPELTMQDVARGRSGAAACGERAEDGDGFRAGGS
ncbi:hypothetical protein [uncultured Microbacterium sp.]|uniref:hypothetical protein n=1 Tax=uncultured Microbacterium sp. TaxID=191216 RepID=UPI0025E8F7E9|nr:hypothetical protein [uncultured Microbacterium sp.]